MNLILKQQKCLKDNDRSDDHSSNLTFIALCTPKVRFS